MFFLMTLVAEQFKVAPVEGDVRVVDVRRRYVFPVMNDATCTTAAFAYTVLGKEIRVAALPPCLAFVEPLRKLFYCDHPPIEKAPVQIEQMLS